VGYFSVKNGNPHAFLYRPSGPVALEPFLAGFTLESSAQGINDNGQITGWHESQSSFTYRAFLMVVSGNAGSSFDIDPLPGGSDNYAFGLNGAGQVVGQSGVARGAHAFAFQDLNGNGACDPGETHDLDTLGTQSSAALAVNDAGTAPSTR